MMTSAHASSHHTSSGFGRPKDEWIHSFIGFVWLLALTLVMLACSSEMVEGTNVSQKYFIVNAFPSTMAGERVAAALALQKWTNISLNQPGMINNPFVAGNTFEMISTLPATDVACGTVPTFQLYVDILVGSMRENNPNALTWPMVADPLANQTINLDSVAGIIGIDCTQAISSAEQFVNLISSSQAGGLPLLISHLTQSDGQSRGKNSAGVVTTNSLVFSTSPNITIMATSYLQMIYSFGWRIEHVGLVFYEAFDGNFLTSFRLAKQLVTGSTKDFLITAAPRPNNNYTTILNQLKASGARIFLLVNNYNIDFGGNFITQAYDFGLIAPGYVWFATNPLLCTNITGLSHHLQQALVGVWCPVLPDAPQWFHDQYMELLQSSASTVPASLKLTQSLAYDPRSYVEDYDLMDMYFKSMAASTQSGNTFQSNLPNILASLNSVILPQPVTPYLAANFTPNNPKQILTWGVIKEDGLLHPVLTIPTDTFQVSYTPGTLGDGTPFTFTQGSSGSWSQPYFPGYPNSAGLQQPLDEVIVVPVHTYYDYSVSSVLQNAFLGIGVVLCVVFTILGAVIIKNRTHGSVKASSLSFNLLILLGGIGLTIDAIVFTLRPESNSAVCEARVWLAILSIQCLLAPLFVRTYRIHSIFNAKELRVVNLSDSMLLARIGLLFVLQTIILIIWSSLSSERSSYTTEDVSGLDDPTNYMYAVVHACHYSTTFFALNVAILFLECIGGSILAFLVRDVTMTDFNESLHIFIVICFIFSYAVIILPLQFVLSDPAALMMLRSAGLEFGVTVCMGVLFVPKLLAIYAPDTKSPSMNKSAFTDSSSLSSARPRTPMPITARPGAGSRPSMSTTPNATTVNQPRSGQLASRSLGTPQLTTQGDKLQLQANGTQKVASGGSDAGKDESLSVRRPNSAQGLRIHHTHSTGTLSPTGDLTNPQILPLPSPVDSPMASPSIELVSSTDSGNPSGNNKVSSPDASTVSSEHHIVIHVNEHESTQVQQQIKSS